MIKSKINEFECIINQYKFVEEQQIEERPKLIRTAQTKAVVEETVEVQQKKTRTAKLQAVGTKKEITDEDEANNGTTKKKVNKSKNAKDDESETVSEKKEIATKTMKKAAPKEEAATAKKDKQPEAEEVPEPESNEAQEKAAETAPKGRNSKIKKLKNIIDTDWQSINFNCSSKNSKGNLANLTLWNVDGLRAWLKKGYLKIIEHGKPDILCIQETKCSSEKLPDEIMNLDAYVTYWACSQKEGYAGVGVASKVKPISVKFGIDSTKFDSEGRCITLDYNQFYLINLYVPTTGRKLVTLEKRLEWNQLFRVIGSLKL